MKALRLWASDFKQSHDSLQVNAFIPEGISFEISTPFVKQSIKRGVLTMTTDTQWAKLRTDVLENIKTLLDSWNGSAEEAVTLISENERNMDQLKKIEEQLREDEAFQYTSVEKQLLTVIIPKHQQMIAAIRSEKINLMNKMKQINQKNKVRDNYVSMQRASVFVDRGI
ncbi:hypothetical protein CAR_c20020 [Carnobacterium sp. 17-4]|nr:hypothetical protein CAR_c20020 [Carnobacterium sp. 17-4]